MFHVHLMYIGSVGQTIDRTQVQNVNVTRVFKPRSLFNEPQETEAIKQSYLQNNKMLPVISKTAQSSTRKYLKCNKTNLKINTQAHW